MHDYWPRVSDNLFLNIVAPEADKAAAFVAPEAEGWQGCCLIIKGQTTRLRVYKVQLKRDMKNMSNVNFDSRKLYKMICENYYYDIHVYIVTVI